MRISKSMWRLSTPLATCIGFSHMLFFVEWIVAHLVKVSHHLLIYLHCNGFTTHNTYTQPQFTGRTKQFWEKKILLFLFTYNNIVLTPQRLMSLVMFNMASARCIPCMHLKRDLAFFFSSHKIIASIKRV